MTRRPDPERIHIARRMAVRSRLAGEGIALELAERWCDAWEAERQGLERGSPDFWRHGTKWVASERSARKVRA